MAQGVVSTCMRPIGGSLMVLIFGIFHVVFGVFDLFFVLQLKCRTFQNFYGKNSRGGEGWWWEKGRHCTASLLCRVNFFSFEQNLMWIPNLRVFRCLWLDLRKMVANAECSRQDMVLLWRKMARGKGCSPASWKIQLLFGTCCYGLVQGRVHVGVWLEDNASVSWSRVERLVQQMQKADWSVVLVAICRCWWLSVTCPVVGIRLSLFKLAQNPIEPMFLHNRPISRDFQWNSGSKGPWCV